MSGCPIVPAKPRFGGSGGLSTFGELAASGRGVGPVIISRDASVTLSNVVSNLNAGEQDSDGDGLMDAIDNCRFTANDTQVDSDGDAVGDSCDPVNDNDVDGDPTRPTWATTATRSMTGAEANQPVRVSRLRRYREQG